MTSFIVDKLIQSDYDLKDWLLTQVPQCLGLLYGANFDNDEKITKEKILNYIHTSYKKSLNYYKNKITESQKFLTEIKYATHLKLNYLNKYLLAMEENNKTLISERTKFYKEKENLSKSIEKVQTLLSKNPSDIIKPGLESSLKFLQESYGFSYNNEFYSKYYNSFPETYELYIEKEIEQNKKDIKYFRKELTNTLKRKKEALDFYQEYTKFIEGNI